MLELIDRKWLEEKGACHDGKEWFLKEGITEPIAGIRNLSDKGHWEWANWLIVRVMSREQYLAYAIFAAEQVIDIFEKKYPNDKRPRKAIEAAKAVLRDDTAATRSAEEAAAGAAAGAAWSAAEAAARSAAWSAAWAAGAAAGSARSAEEAAAEAAARAAGAEAVAVAGARAAMRKKILEYGLSLLEKAGSKG